MSYKLTHDRLKELLAYNSDNGVFVWKQNKAQVQKGSLAGWIDHYGYRRIGIDGSNYKACRLAFLYMTGKFPQHTVDHIDGNKKNDKWLNLRDVTHRENMLNVKIRIDSSTGVHGVTWDKWHKKWRTFIHVNGVRKQVYRGIDFFEAVAARKSAEREYGFHENHGTR